SAVRPKLVGGRVFHHTLTQGFVGDVREQAGLTEQHRFDERRVASGTPAARSGGGGAGTAAHTPGGGRGGAGRSAGAAAGTRHVTGGSGRAREAAGARSGDRPTHRAARGETADAPSGCRGSGD